MDRPNINMSILAAALLAGSSIGVPSFNAVEEVPPRRRPRSTGFEERSTGYRRYTPAYEPGCWKGDGVPVTTVTRQMRRMADRKAARAAEEAK